MNCTRAEQVVQHLPPRPTPVGTPVKSWQLASANRLVRGFADLRRLRDSEDVRHVDAIVNEDSLVNVLLQEYGVRHAGLLRKVHPTLDNPVRRIRAKRFQNSRRETGEFIGVTT